MNPVLGSPEGLVFSGFVVDIAEAMRLGLTDKITLPKGTHSPNEEGITRLTPASTAASTSTYSLFMLSPPHYLIETLEARSPL